MSDTKSVIFYFRPVDPSTARPVGYRGSVHIAGIGDVRYEVLSRDRADTLYDATPKPDESVMNSHALAPAPVPHE